MCRNFNETVNRETRQQIIEEKKLERLMQFFEDHDPFFSNQKELVKVNYTSMGF